MKKIIITVVITLALIFTGYIFITGDTENRIARLGVTFFDGDYVITHYGLSDTNVWLVIDGKVTSEPAKGYYHTRVISHGNKTAYLQLPLDNTVVEEYKNFNQLTLKQKEVLIQKYGENFLLKE